MKHNTIAKKLSMTALAAAMVAAPAINVFAATADATIDTSRKCSLTIHKYDITAATEKGFDSEKYKPNGEQNAAAEQELENYTIEGVEFTYMKVGDISTDTVGGKVQVMYAIPQKLEDILGLTDTRGDHRHSSGEINDAIETALISNTYTKNQLEKYVMEFNGHTAMPMTDTNGVSHAENLDVGLYLIIETKVPANVTSTVDPFFVSLPMTNDKETDWFYDVHAYPKNQTNIPDLDKLVRQNDDVAYGKPEYKDTATSSEGENLDYILVSHLPKITSEATHLTEYTFVDTIAKGLTYNRDLSIYFYNNENDARANNVNNAVEHWTGTENFRVNYNAASEKASECRVEMTDAGLNALNHTDGKDQIESDFSGRWMVLSYSAKVNADSSTILGDFGNRNDVSLRWSRSNTKRPDTLKDKARVYSYGLDITKKFEASDATKQGDATKVSFSLKNKTDGHYIVAKQDKAGSGIYYVVDNSKVQYGTVNGQTISEKDAEAQATKFTPAADGTLIINGLEADEYVLAELTTDSDYTLLKDPITINIKATVDEFVPSKTTLYDTVAAEQNKAEGHNDCIETNGDRASATVDGSATEMQSQDITTIGGTAAGNANVSTNARVKMAITNSPKFKLPATGGAGTIAFTVAGCAVAFAGVAIATKKSKKEDDKKE